MMEFENCRDKRDANAPERARADDMARYSDPTLARADSRPPVPANGIFRGKPHPRLSGQRNQCGACGELFNSNSAFDAHRAGRYEPDERRCLTVAEMEGRGFTNPDGFWRMPISDKDQARLRKLRGRRTADYERV